MLEVSAFLCGYSHFAKHPKHTRYLCLDIIGEIINSNINNLLDIIYLTKYTKTYKIKKYIIRGTKMLHSGVYIGSDFEMVVTERYIITYRRNKERDL